MFQNCERERKRCRCRLLNIANDEEFDTSNLLRIRHQTDFPWETTWTRLNGRLLRTAVDEDNVIEDNESDDTLSTIHLLKVVIVLLCCLIKNIEV